MVLDDLASAAAHDIARFATLLLEDKHWALQVLPQGMLKLDSPADFEQATVGHNTMVFNCDNGTPERCNQDDQSISTIVHFDPTGVSLVDMSDAYNKHGISKYQRGFSLAEHDSVVVVQDVFAGASNFTWTMHTLANITVQGTKAKLQAGNKVIYAVLESPSNSLQFSTAEATDSPPQRPLVGIQKLMVAGTSDGATERLTVCFGLSIEACPAPQ